MYRHRVRRKSSRESSSDSPGAKRQFRARLTSPWTGGSRTAKAAQGGGGDPNVRRLEADLAETLGASVSIEHGPKGGRVVIRYHGLEEIEGILAHIK